MDDYRELRSFLRKLESKAGSDVVRDQVRALEGSLDRLNARISTLKAQLSSARVQAKRAKAEAESETARLHDAKAAEQRAWIDGHEQGVADGFAECQALMRGRSDG